MGLRGASTESTCDSSRGRQEGGLHSGFIGKLRAVGRVAETSEIIGRGREWFCGVAVRMEQF